MVRYHIPYGTIPIPYSTIPYTIWYFSLLFPWYFSLLFPQLFWYSDVWLSLASSLSLGFTHGERYTTTLPPGITIRQTAISLPRWTFHPLSTRVLTLLLKQHPTPLYPPAYWHNKCLGTWPSPKAGIPNPQAVDTSPASPRGPTSSHTPLLGTSTPLLCFTPWPTGTSQQALPWVQSGPGPLYKQTKICWLAEVHHQGTMLVVTS